MNLQEQKTAAKKFVKQWKGKGSERSESQPFWLSLLSNVYGVEQPDEYIRFETPVQLSHKSFIDGFIDATHVIIEQKSCDKNLNEPIKQSDGTFLTPYQQAKRYAAELPYSQRARWIIACNFKEFHIYDMENPQAEPEIILLENLDKEYYRLQFLIDKSDTNIKKEFELSIKAGIIVSDIYDSLHKQYVTDDDESLKNLNKLCVRLVFCLYADSSGLFGKHKLFCDYLSNFKNFGAQIILENIFTVLNQPEDERDDNELNIFPYVNGGLFKEKIKIPRLSKEFLDLLIDNAGIAFNWSGISPTIFGALFESTLNPVVRRKDGMHYTSIENIHKLIDPLFLDDLKSELADIKSIKVIRTRKNKLLALQNKLASLKFLDPACGSGNFLTETYLSLRRLENEILKELIGAQITLGDLHNPIKVSISQFYSIEINDFAVSVAKTALWIAEAQMLEETKSIIYRNLDYKLDFLPLKTSATIIEGNALQIDWNDIEKNIDYIMGNPPFIGAMVMNHKQRLDVRKIWNNIQNSGELDYVSAWYKKSADYMNNKKTEAAFVSTNSVIQGQQATTIWQPLMSSGININFAQRSFQWWSESTKKAQVHCVIIGFSYQNKDDKIIIDYNKIINVNNINSYLLDAPQIFIKSHSNPICNVPEMKFGNMPRDGGNFILTSAQRNEFIKSNPISEKFIKPYIGAKDFINKKSRYCLWLVDAKPNELQKMPLVLKRIEAVKNFRLNSKALATRKFADKPTLFCQIAQLNMNYIAIPRVSSEKRKYIPIGFMNKEVIASDAMLIIPNGKIYHFGILTSSVHMAWTRIVCGRLEMRYRYSKDIVYNNFPWCNPTDEQKKKIEKTAQQILDARKLYPGMSLANFYNNLDICTELKEAHQANDKAVMQAYGFNDKMTENEIVIELMKRKEDILCSKKK